MEIAEESGEKIYIKEVSILSPAGLEKIQKHGIKGVPTIIVNGRTKITGVPSREKMYNVIKTFFSAMFLKPRIPGPQTPSHWTLRYTQV